MNGFITVPTKGDGLKATWGASVANGINALMPMASAGMLVRDGAGGVGCEPLPRNHRDRIVSSATLPWTFICTVENAGTQNETRNGAWYNAQVQIGLDFHHGPYWKNHPYNEYIHPGHSLHGGTISGCNQTEDGDYYLRLIRNVPTLVRQSAGSAAPNNDYENDTYYVYVGTVQNAVQTDGIHAIPVIYIYL